MKLKFMRVVVLLGILIQLIVAIHAQDALPLPPSSEHRTPAHALIFSLDAQGQVSVKDYRAVTLDLAEVTTTPQTRNALAAHVAQDHLYDYVRVQLHDDATQAVVYEDVVGVSRWLRGEFAIDPTDLSVTNAEGSNIDGHQFAAQDRTFWVKVPAIEGATQMTIAPISQPNQAHSINLNTAISRFNRPQSTDTELIMLTGYTVTNAANRRDIVILGDGYRTQDRSKFITDSKNLADALFSIAPFSNYRNYFNVVAVFAPSQQTGADQPAGCPDNDPPMSGQMRNTRYDSTYCYSNIARLLVATNYTKIYEDVAEAYPDGEEIFVIVNDTLYGGSGGTIATVSTNAYAALVLQHEIGHSIVKLGDEYDTLTPGYPGCSDYGRAGITAECAPNITDVTVRNNIKWNYWINADTPIPTTGSAPATTAGLWVGAHYSPHTYYRPCFNCIMKSLGQPFGPVAAEQLPIVLYSSPSNSISIVETDGVTPANNAEFTIGLHETQEFSVKVLSPGTGDNTRVRWSIDNVTTEDDFVGHLKNGKFTFDPTAEGIYSITAVVSDRGGVLHNTKANVSRQSLKWTVTVKDMGITPTATETATEKPTVTPTPTPTVPPTATPIHEDELIINGGFESGLDSWNLKNPTSDKVKCNKPDKNKFFSYTGDCAFMFKGSVGEKSKLIQKPSVDGVTLQTGDGLSFKIWADVRKTPSTKYKVVVKYTDNSEKSKIVGSLALTEGYALSSGSLDLLSGNLSSIKVMVVNKSASGKLFIDDLSLRAIQ